MLVCESLEDLLKPKGEDEIKKSLENIIFWKGIANGKLSPTSMKYYLDKDFIERVAKGYRYLKKPIRTKTEKTLLLILDLITQHPEYRLEVSVFNYMSNLIAEWIAGYRKPDDTLKHINITINREYDKLNNRYYSITGKNLRED